jgi:hypothetical protein
VTDLIAVSRVRLVSTSTYLLSEANTKLELQSSDMQSFPTYWSKTENLDGKGAITMRTIHRFLIVPALVAGALWWATSSPVLAEPVIDDGDMNACATLLGEGEECDWPVAEPGDVPDSDFLYDPPVPADCLAEDDKVCAGIEPDLNAGADTEPGCPVQVGEGVLCTGPDPLEVPGDEGSEESNEAEAPEGTDIPDLDTTEGSDFAGDCQEPVGEGVIGCGPETPEVPEEEDPVGGQEVSVVRIFVPTLTK